MFLKNLFLRNFRNYSLFKISFNPRLNIICGDNAVGKTNLLEAIQLISTGKSFRTLNLQELIKHGQSYFYIEAQIEAQNVLQSIKIYYDEKSKKITHNSSNYKTFTSLLGILPSSLLSPDDLNLIKEKPLIRRKFLNIHLAQIDPLYVHHYQRFLKALKQRNHILKTNKTNLLTSFNIELCKSGSYLSYARKQFIDKMQNPLQDILKKLSKVNTRAKIKYISSIECTDEIKNTYENYLRALEKNQKKDLDFKTTLIGPHRDDFYVSLNSKSAKNFASEGQKKLLLYALRFAEWERLSSILDTKALFLIDDFDAHLDETHKNNLKQEISNFSQVFITMPKVGEKFDNASFINIKENNT